MLCLHNEKQQPNCVLNVLRLVVKFPMTVDIIPNDWKTAWVQPKKVSYE